jgi:hypothetical protein
MRETPARGKASWTCPTFRSRTTSRSYLRPLAVHAACQVDALDRGVPPARIRYEVFGPNLWARAVTCHRPPIDLPPILRLIPEPDYQLLTHTRDRPGTPQLRSIGHRPVAFAAATSASPAGCIRRAASKASTLAALIFDHGLPGRRGEYRWRK